jgi:L-lactate dehydrogenase complex protein LldF
MSSAFRRRATQALGRVRVRGNIRRAMDGLVQKRLAAFPDPHELEQLRDQAAAIRDQALARLPELLEQLEARCTANGIQVHWAEDADAANRLIIGLLNERNADALLKGKSMVSEEIGLNRALEAEGIEPVETDLGELIIQLAGDHPSHIVAPAVHKDRHEIATLFAEHLSDETRGEYGRQLDAGGGHGHSPEEGVEAPGARSADQSEGTAGTRPMAGRVPSEEARLAEIERLTAQARRLMRGRFRQVRAGLSGVNFAVAETGTLCLVENEGNGRLSTTAPDLHIAIMGVEKVIARLDQLPPLLTLLTRSATGQPITTYVNLISGPRRGAERDGPHEVHLVLLDNGRSRIHQDLELRQTLRCIRCGACMNHCPVYTRIGGHGYGTVYPGPIGAILEPQLQGLQQMGELAEASSLCGACAEVCPVRIPIPSLLNRLRYDRAQGRGIAGGGRPGLQGWAWRLWALIYRSPQRYRRSQWVATRLLRRLGEQLPVAAWGHSRSAPRIAPRTLHQLALEAGFLEPGLEPGRGGGAAPDASPSRATR